MNLKEATNLELINFITQYYYADAKAELLSRLSEGEKAIEELEKYKMICLRQKRIWKLEE